MNDDLDFFESDRIVLETLDDIYEYLTTVDLWLAMHDESEKDVVGSESFGYYTLHIFDSPIEIVTSDGDVLDSFKGAVVFDSPGKMEEREIQSFTFSEPEQAQQFFDQMKEDFSAFVTKEQLEEEETMYSD